MKRAGRASHLGTVEPPGLPCGWGSDTWGTAVPYGPTPPRKGEGRSLLHRQASLGVRADHDAFALAGEFRRNHMRLIGAAAVLVLVGAMPATTAELPTRKAGLWELKMS